MTIHTGTEDTRTAHSPPAAVFNLMLAMGVPMALAFAGLAIRGWDAIAWGAAIVWGMVATVAMLLFSAMGKSMGMTRMDLNDLVGSMFAKPGTSGSRKIGAAVHLMDGALLGVGFAYATALLGWPATWATGLAWGIVLWVLAMILMTSIGAVHPAIRRGEEPDPGPLARNFGRLTPVGSLLGHAVYGLVLGSLYQILPF